MKKHLLFLCALFLVLGANAAPLAFQAGKLSKDHFAKEQVSKETTAQKMAIGGKFVPAQAIKRAPAAKMQTYDVTIVDCVGTNWGTDIQYIMNDADGQYRFAFDIFLPDGQEDVTLGQTYTLDDMDTEYTWGGNPTTQQSFADVTAATFLKTVDPVTGLVNVTASATDADGNVYNIVYQEEPLPEAQDTVLLVFGQDEISLNDYTMQQGVFQFVGEKEDVSAYVAIKSNKIVGTYTANDFNMNYCGIYFYDSGDTTFVGILGGDVFITFDSISSIYTVAAKLLGKDTTLYKINMQYYKAPLVITGDTINIEVTDSITFKYYASEGDWYIKGQNADYKIYLDLVNNDSTSSAGVYTADDVLASYNYVVQKATNTKLTMKDISAIVAEANNRIDVVVDMLCSDGNVYHITIQAENPVELDFNYGDVRYMGTENAVTTWIFTFSAQEDVLPSVTFNVTNNTTHGIAGTYQTYTNGSYQPNVNATDIFTSFELNVSYAGQGADYNLYSIELIFGTDNGIYHFNKTIEIAGYTADYSDPYALTDDNNVPTAPTDDQQEYYIKNNWNSGEWVWQAMTAVGDGTNWAYTGIFGGTGVNINTTADDEDALWFPISAMLIGEGSAAPSAGDSVLFVYNSTAETLTATVLSSAIQSYPAYYIVGDFNNWDIVNAVEMTTTDGVNYYVHLDTLYGSFKITSARDWSLRHWGASESDNVFSYNEHSKSYFGYLRDNYDLESYPQYDIHVDQGYTNATIGLNLLDNNGTTRYRIWFAYADPFVGAHLKINDIWYEITSFSPATVKVIGNTISTPTDLIIPDSVNVDGKHYAVTEIGGYTFNYCSNLTSVVIPESLQCIGDHAFGYCGGLTSVTWNAINCNTDYDEFYRPFRSCSNITSFVFGNQVQKIPANLCYQMTGLTSIVIPESVDTIVKNAFSGCTNITSVTWNAKHCANVYRDYRNYDENGYRIYEWYESSSCPFPSSVQNFTIGNQVEVIPAGLCSNMNQLTSVTLPNTLKKIANYAFNGCTGITSITLPNNLTHIGNSAFNGCTGITSILLPNALTYIGDFAFYGTGLSSILIPENVDTIGSGVFYGCNNLTSVTWNAKYYTYIRDRKYYDYDLYQDVYYELFPSTVQSFVFGNQVERIADHLCAGLSQLSSVALPNTLTYIGESAFSGTNLSSVLIPENVDTIVRNAFTNCNNLSLVIWNARLCTNVYIFHDRYDDGVYDPETGLWVYPWDNDFDWDNGNVFYTNNSQSPFPSTVVTFIFGDNVQNVPSGLCNGLNQLTSIALPNTVTKIGGYAFSGCSGLISFTMENGVTEIGRSAFSGCSNLPQIVIPNSVTKIGNSAFSWCYNLTTATIGNNVDTIGVSAFSNCKRLISIELPATVSYMGGDAFYNCSSMNKAVIHSTTQFDPSCYLMYNAQLDTVVVPASLFNIEEREWVNTTKKMKYLRINSGELTENAMAVIRRSASTLETLDVAATTNTTMADEAFSDMYRLTTLALPSGLTDISYKAAAECVNLAQVTIPASVVTIGQRAFENCRSLQSITFSGNNLQTIGNWAFYNNHALRQIAIPAGVQTIGDGAFYGCTYLDNVAMPASLRSVGDNAFALCNHLTKMQVEAALPPQVAARTFFDVSRTIPVYVPDESLNDYRNTQVWQEFMLRPISQAATGLYEVEPDGQNGADNMQPDGKFMQNGRLLIRKNGRVYDTQGRLIE